MPESRLRTQKAIGARERSLAKAVGALLMLGAGFVALSLALPHPSGGDSVALASIGCGMFLGGALCWALSARLPRSVAHLILVTAALATGALIYASGVAAGNYGSIFVWAILIAAYFFPRRAAVAHLGWILVVYAVTLVTVESTAGYSPLTRWLFTAVSLTVVMLITTEVVRHRARADQRARRFFDLSQDMLSTMDVDGRCVEVNAAWKACLGYSAEDLEGRPLLAITHPADLERATERALAMFRGEAVAALETRVRAKDGSWHWLRSTATYADDEKLVYARSTDITELKQIEAEREGLLHEVERLALSDSLTGLPNRRALQEQLPREMTRSRRSQSPLCLAIIDIDLFKAFNDSHGHLVGDELLLECAIAWDSKLRGVDAIARFGGEEFVVVLPDCDLDQAAAIVERLRAATPRGQTVSAGLSRWDQVESVEDLIGRADRALYRAKEAGRDRLVHALA